eukprot:COSAG04_NODE_238_length_19079_cov_9.187039_11_plen_474_part_00
MEACPDLTRLSPRGRGGGGGGDSDGDLWPSALPEWAQVDWSQAQQQLQQQEEEMQQQAEAMRERERERQLQRQREQQWKKKEAEKAAAAEKEAAKKEAAKKQRAALRDGGRAVVVVIGSHGNAVGCQAWLRSPPEASSVFVQDIVRAITEWSPSEASSFVAVSLAGAFAAPPTPATIRADPDVVSALCAGILKRIGCAQKRFKQRARALPDDLLAALECALDSRLGAAARSSQGPPKRRRSADEQELYDPFMSNQDVETEDENGAAEAAAKAKDERSAQKRAAAEADEKAREAAEQAAIKKQKLAEEAAAAAAKAKADEEARVAALLRLAADKQAQADEQAGRTEGPEAALPRPAQQHEQRDDGIDAPRDDGWDPSSSFGTAVDVDHAVVQQNPLFTSALDAVTAVLASANNKPREPPPRARQEGGFAVSRAADARPDRETILDRPYFFVSAKRGQAEHSDKENIQNQAQATG